VVPTDPNQTLLAVWLAAQDELRRLVAALGVGRDQVDDVLQDVYLAANTAEERTWDDGGQRRWLFRVTINRCRLEHRRRRSWQGLWEKLQRAWTRPEDIGDAISRMKSRSSNQLQSFFAPAREVDRPPLQEYVFWAPSVEEAQGLARDFLDFYDRGFLGWLRELAEDQKARLTASRRDAAPKLADLELRAAEQEEKLEGVERLDDPALSDLKVKRMLLKVDLAGVKARLQAIDKKMVTVAVAIRTRLSDLKITAEIDLASLAAQQQLLDELIDGQRQLRELSEFRYKHLAPVKDLVHMADVGIERCDEILADLIPFALVNETVVIRPMKFSLPGETAPAK